MKTLATAILSAAALLFATPAALAQTNASALATYTGPRYPGGPDSLRALIARSTRMTTPAPTGRMLVQFELQPDGRPSHFNVVRPPAKDKLLAAATATAVQYLEAHMLTWQPASNKNKAPTEPEREPKINLLIDFTTPSVSQPYYYADQNPTFANVVQNLRAQYTKLKNRPMTDAEMEESFAFGASAKGLAKYIQYQVRYPAQAMRGGESGTVYAYFEVAENGAIEQATILGSAGSNLDEEVLRVVKSLSTATTSAALHGQPVRVYYIMPVTFKMM